MARDPMPPSLSDRSRWLRVLQRPWSLLLAGLVLNVLALLLLYFNWLTTLGVLLMGAGLVLAGAAVERRLRTAGSDPASSAHSARLADWLSRREVVVLPELAERIESAGLVAAAACVAFIAYLAAHERELGIVLLLGALAGVALVGSVLVLLPRVVRRIVVSLLIVYHFGGILTATTAVAPPGPGSSIPWITAQLWARVYRPYLSFIYMTNAYHFYSPDPGPPTLLWFRIQYEGGKVYWYKVPDRSTSPIGLHYQRMLALTEYINAPNPRLPFSEMEKRQFEHLTGLQYNHDTWEDITRRREAGNEPKAGVDPIGIIPYADMAPTVQYQEPQEHAKLLLASYARHVAHTVKHPDDPSLAVERVKVYRLGHNLLTPAEVAKEMNPYNPTMYYPYYMGEFDRGGKLMDPRDPYLYWFLPITYVPPGYPEADRPIIRTITPRGGRLLNSLEIHAGDANSPTSPFAEKK